MLTSLSFVACLKNQQITQKTPFENKNPSIALNQVIQFSIPIDIRTHKPYEYENHSFIDLMIENKSNKTIRFSNDYGFIIYRFDDSNNSWEEVDNITGYGSKQPIYLLSKRNKEYESLLSDFYLNLPEGKIPVTIRVIAVGDIIEGSESIEKTGAYIDLVIDE
jgi:hypothetical protein